MQNFGQNSCKVSCQKLLENSKDYLVGVLGSEDLCFCSNFDFPKICTTPLF